jgi:hypothetical protein
MYNDINIAIIAWFLFTIYFHIGINVKYTNHIRIG